jgi:hypothetical protein
MAKEEKSGRIGVRMAPSELEMLRELAEREGESDAVVVRRLIREAHAGLVRDRRPKSKR